ncbi:MAG: enolase C-terminal domain-like protein [Nanoarchaeota archaeon]
MNIQKIWGEKAYDSRKQETIRVYVKTKMGTWSTSSPSGNSTGKYETPAFVKNVGASIKMLEEAEEKIKELEIGVFNDLEKVEKIVDKNEIGANTLYALEASILKALAYENKQELWQLINPNADRFPFPVGNIIGGGKHSRLTNGKKPDFQEFLIIPKMKKFSDCVDVMKKAHELVGEYLEAKKAKGVLDDEGAWSTSLDNSDCLEIIDSVRNDVGEQGKGKIDIGIDVAASTFYSPDIYHYTYPEVLMESGEQIEYVSGLADKFKVFYIEDPIDEDDFKNFKNFREKNAGRMIVGDDLTVSNEERFLKALKEKSIDAVILKPNQTGSLLEIKKIVYLAKKYNIFLVMSHRAGETIDSTIADLAFGFQCDYIKTGAHGKEREIKLRRLIEIENKIRK